MTEHKPLKKDCIEELTVLCLCGETKLYGISPIEVIDAIQGLKKENCVFKVMMGNRDSLNCKCKECLKIDDWFPIINAEGHW